MVHDVDSGSPSILDQRFPFQPGLKTARDQKDKKEEEEEEEEEGEAESVNQKMMMNVVSALTMTRILTRDHSAAAPYLGNEAVPFGSVLWYTYAGISFFLVCFAGIMSGLTLGLMSLSLVDIEILERSGSPSEKKQAGTSSLLPFSLLILSLLLLLSLLELIFMILLPPFLFVCVCLCSGHTSSA